MLIGLVLGELCGYLLYFTGLLIPAVLLAFLILYDRRKGKRKPFFILFFILLLSMLLGNLSACLEKHKVEVIRNFCEQTDGASYFVKGVILERKESDSGYVTFTLGRPTLALTSEESEFTFHGKLQLTGSLSEEEKKKYLPGDEVCFPASVSLPSLPSNPGSFHERIYYFSNGIYLRGFFTSCDLIKKSQFSLQKAAYLLRNQMERVYRDHLGQEESAILSAMVFADKSGLTQEEKQLFEENGLMHLLAVSGLHVSIVGGRIYKTLRKKGQTYLISCLFGWILYFFMAVWQVLPVPSAGPSVCMHSF